MAQAATQVALIEEHSLPRLPKLDANTVLRHVAHELRQPLSTIESIAYYLELIIPEDNQRARQQVARLQELVEQSNWIVSSAVHYTQSTPPSTEFVDILDVLARAVEPYSDVDVEVLGRTPPVRLDLEQADHLFANLLAFFRQVADNGQQIKVQVRSIVGVVTVSLEVRAVGFGPFEIESMFDPLYTDRRGCSGLGLASARRIVEAHGGSLHVSAGPGSMLYGRVEFAA
jgi:signal transduction histidine kinase